MKFMCVGLCVCLLPIFSNIVNNDSDMHCTVFSRLLYTSFCEKASFRSNGVIYLLQCRPLLLRQPTMDDSAFCTSKKVKRYLEHQSM